MKNKLLISLNIMLLSAILIACPNNSPTPTPVDPNSKNYCQLAEVHLKELGCIPKNTSYTLQGKNFTQFCQDKLNQHIDLHPQCLSQIKSCDEMDACVQMK